MKISVLIVDDEVHARSFLRELLNLIYGDKIVILSECATVQEAVKAIVKYNPDVVFLDIQMPDQNGFELFNYISDRSFEVIFTTAHKNFALDAIKLSAFDYLLKPINMEELQASIARLEVKFQSEVTVNKFKVLLENLETTKSRDKKIIISTKTGFEVLFTNQIMYCKAEESYSHFFTEEKTILSSKAFKDICEVLSEPIFIRVHKSYLVNINFIKKFNTADYSLELMGGMKIPVSDKSFTKKKLIDAISK